MRTNVIVTVFCVVLVASANRSQGQVRPTLSEPTDIGRDSTPAERMDYMKSSAETYAMTSQPDGTPLVLHPDALLRWSNPISNIPDGVVMMWTLDGVPEVVAQLFLSRANIWFHEFQSLTEGELAVENRLSQTEFWKPRHSVKREAMPGAPAPAESPAQRLIQMNQIARRFSASVKFKLSPRKPDLTLYELRRLPRPIYRYQSRKRDIVDGALYAFVQGTNPEVFLLIEAHRKPSGTEYRYGLSPMTGYEVNAKIGAEEVWRAGPQKRPFPTEGPFFFVHHQPIKKK